MMGIHLKKDICNLRHPGTARVEVKAHLIDNFLPPELQYACLYWVKHQKTAIMEPYETKMIMDFLKAHLLHWIEALVLMNRSWEIPGLLKTLCIICQVGPILKMLSKSRSCLLLVERFIFDGILKGCFEIS